MDNQRKIKSHCTKFELTERTCNEGVGLEEENETRSVSMVKKESIH
jgi:hypothetical protein